MGEKKSWREIDRQRDGQRGGGRRDSEERNRERAQQQHSSAYNQYKNDLSKLFDGAGAPEYLQKMTGQNDETSRSRLALLGAIQRSTNPRELNNAVTAYREKFEGWPLDESLIVKLLECSNEAVQAEALALLREFMEINPLSNKQSIKLRLEQISLMGDDDDLIDEAEELLDELR